MSSKRVLIAHKDQKIAKLVAQAAKAAELEAVVAFDGMHASQLTEKKTYDVCLLSAKLDRLSGVQVAANLRQSTNNSKAHIILLVADADRETKQRAEKIGDVKVIADTTDTDALVKAIIAAIPKPTTANSSAYDVRIINTFIAATSSIFKSYLGASPTIGKPTIKKTDIAVGYISGLIDFTGVGVRGSMAISLQKSLMPIFLSKILPGSAVTDDSMIDLAGELSNQICGAVKINLAKVGVRVMIGLPKVVLGKDHRITHIVKNPTLILEVRFGQELCTVEFCMMKTNDEPLKETETNDMEGGSAILF
jgi:chemotaxis protein CheX